MRRDGRNFAVDVQQLVDGHLGCSHRILHRKDDIFRYFNELADESEVPGAAWNRQRPVARLRGMNMLVM